MSRTLTLPAHVSLAAFDAMFEKLKNWDRWGEDDELGTLNYITPEKVAAAARLVRKGRCVSMAISNQQDRRARQSQSGGSFHVAAA